MERSRNIEYTEQCTGEISTDEKGWAGREQERRTKGTQNGPLESSAESLSVHERKIWKKTS